MCTKCPVRGSCKEEFSSKACNAYRACNECPGSILCGETYGNVNCNIFRNKLAQHAAAVTVRYLKEQPLERILT